MNNKYLITYELNGSKNYSSLYDVIKSYPAWWHYIENSWIIATNESANEIVSRITPHIDKVKDSLLVIKIDSSNRQGWLPKKAYEWFNKN